MTELERTDQPLRHSILKLLSESEVARISMVETQTHLSEGDEYIDLDGLEHGVRLVRGPARPLRAIPRKAVQVATWYQILARLSDAAAKSARSV